MKLISLYELVSDAKLGAETELRSVKFGCILTFGNLEKRKISVVAYRHGDLS